MKVLMLNYEFPPLGGGAGNATYYLLREFSRRKYINVDLITSSSGDSEKKEKFSDNINIYYLNIGKKSGLSYQTAHNLLSYSVRSLFFSRDMKNKYGYDLVHAFFGIPCGFIAMLLGLPYIVSLRGSDVPFYNKRFELLDRLFFSGLSRRIWNRAEYVVANSEGLKELANKNDPGREIKVIYNGVDTNEFIPDLCRDKNKKIKLVSTGRLIRRKGYEHLIGALKDETDIELYLIGDGDLRSELERTAKELNAPVFFSGRKDHAVIRDHLQKADIFVLPSLNEGMSNSILEAMACGLPIITTDVGGSGELVRGNGIVVEKNSAESIRKALEEYKTVPSLLSEHGKRSREIAEGMGWDKAASDYFELYKKIAIS